MALVEKSGCLSSWGGAGGYGLAGEVEVEGARCEDDRAVVDSRAIANRRTDKQAVLLAETQELVWASEVMMGYVRSDSAGLQVVLARQAMPASSCFHCTPPCSS